jgi:hypothetical protein
MFMIFRVFALELFGRQRVPQNRRCGIGGMDSQIDNNADQTSA